MINKWLLAVFHWAVWLCFSSERRRNLKSSTGLAGISRSAHVWQRSSLTEEQGQRRSGPVLASSQSTPSPWGLLERNELSIEQSLQSSYREMSGSVLPVCLCEFVCRRVGQVCASFLMSVFASESNISWYRPVICGLFCCQATEALPTVMRLSTSIQISSTGTAHSNIYDTKNTEKYIKLGRGQQLDQSVWAFMWGWVYPHALLSDPTPELPILSQFSICVFHFVELIKIIPHMTIPTLSKYFLTINGDTLHIH